MGRGDKKTRRGKISAGSYGKCRPRRAKKINKKRVEKVEPKSEE